MPPSSGGGPEPRHCAAVLCLHRTYKRAPRLTRPERGCKTPQTSCAGFHGRRVIHNASARGCSRRARPPRAPGSTHRRERPRFYRGGAGARTRWAGDGRSRGRVSTSRSPRSDSAPHAGRTSESAPRCVADAGCRRALAQRCDAALGRACTAPGRSAYRPSRSRHDDHRRCCIRTPATRARQPQARERRQLMRGTATSDPIVSTAELPSAPRRVTADRCNVLESSNPPPLWR
jgi:hypothetical protein